MHISHYAIIMQQIGIYMRVTVIYWRQARGVALHCSGCMYVDCAKRQSIQTINTVAHIHGST